VTVSPRQCCSGHANYWSRGADSHAAVDVVNQTIGLCSDIHFNFPSLLVVDWGRIGGNMV
jgi:hypothetical protein